jgi:lantibiotic modifying enzyme
MSALAQPILTDPRERFLDVAWSIGTRLCRDAIWDGDRCNWLGDSMEAHGGEWKVAHKSFGADLYSGTSGIALFLARLHRMRPDPLLAQTARGAIAQALSHVDDLPPAMRHALYAGWIGIALALLDVAQLLDDRPLKREALRLVDRQLGHEIDPMSLDVIGGAAGAIAGLCAIDRRIGSDRFLDEARRLGEHLLTHAHRTDDGWSWTTMSSMGPTPQNDLAGYSHGAAGIAVALLELHTRTRDDRFLEAALGGFAYERSCFSPEQQNWPDFRSFATPSPQ